jgi:hypothetical protein
MKAQALVIFLLLFSSIPPLSAQAVSFSPVPGEHEEKETKGIYGKGEIICLFQSGTEDIRKTIIAGDILVVFRDGGKHDVRETGKIKVLTYVGEDYLRGEVLEGEVLPGDIARKGSVASLVISSSDKCKEKK